MSSPWSPHAVRGLTRASCMSFAVDVWMMWPWLHSFHPCLWEEGSQPEHCMGGVGAFSRSETRVTALQSIILNYYYYSGLNNSALQSSRSLSGISDGGR